MNREIKFRALAPNKQGELVWFYDVATDGDEVLIYTKIRKCWCILKDVKAIVEFTGILDKQGVDIYDGDIVVINDTNFEDDDDQIPWQIKKMDGAFVLFYSDDDYYYFDKNIDSFLHGFPDGWEIEVIGSIYENPELLERVK